MNTNLIERTATECPRRTNRRGVGQLEIIVAAVLMGVLTGMLSTLSYQLQRVHKDARNYQLAVYEITNHLRRLQSLPSEQLPAEINSLKLSEVAKARLEQAELKGALISDPLGTRIDVQINWNRIGPAEPVKLSAWVNTETSSSQSGSATENGAMP